MAIRHTKNLVATFVILLTLLEMTGCSGSSYTIEGAAQVKKVIVTTENGEKTAIDLGSAVGGGLWKYVDKDEVEQAALLNQSVPFTAEPGNGVKIVGQVFHEMVTISEVYLNGKRLKNW